MHGIYVYCFYLCIHLNTQSARTGMRRQSERIFACFFKIFYNLHTMYERHKAWSVEHNSLRIPLFLKSKTLWLCCLFGLDFIYIFNNFRFSRESNNEISVDSAGMITGENFREMTPRPQSASHKSTRIVLWPAPSSSPLFLPWQKRSNFIFAWQLWLWLEENQDQEESC